MNDDKIYKVIVLKRAAANLYEHIEFLARVNIQASIRMADNFERAFASLSKMPERCPVFITRKTKESYRQLIIGRYQIIFSIKDKEGIVNIQYVLDSRQDNDI